MLPPTWNYRICSKFWKKHHHHHHLISSPYHHPSQADLALQEQSIPGAPPLSQLGFWLNVNWIALRFGEPLLVVQLSWIKDLQISGKRGSPPPNAMQSVLQSTGSAMELLNTPRTVEHVELNCVTCLRPCCPWTISFVLKLYIHHKLQQEGQL